MVLRSSLAFLFAGILACGCGTGDGKKENTDKKNAKGKGDKPRIVLLTNNPDSFWTIAERGAEKAEKDFDIELLFRRPPAPGTVAEQTRILEDLMQTGIDAVAISPNDPKNFVGFLKSKVASKMPLICQDSDLPDPEARRCYLGTPNYRAGRSLGALVAKAVPEGGKIAIFVGKVDVQNAVERRQGLLDFLAGKEQQDLGEITPTDATNVKVGKYVLVETKTDNVQSSVCQQKAEDLLTREPDIACLIGLWNYNPPALLKAVKALKLNKSPAIVGFDEAYQTLEGIRSGDIVGTVVQDPYNFGYESIKILAAMVRDGDDRILKSYTVDDKKRVFIPHRVITREVEKLPEGITTIQVDQFYADLKKVKGDAPR